MERLSERHPPSSGRASPIGTGSTASRSMTARTSRVSIAGAAGRQERSIAVATPLRLAGGRLGGYTHRASARVRLSNAQIRAVSPGRVRGIVVLDRVDSVRHGDRRRGFEPGLTGALAASIDHDAHDPLVRRVSARGKSLPSRAIRGALAGRHRPSPREASSRPSRGPRRSRSSSTEWRSSPRSSFALFLSVLLGRRERRIEDLRLPGGAPGRAGGGANREPHAYREPPPRGGGRTHARRGVAARERAEIPWHLRAGRGRHRALQRGREGSAVRIRSSRRSSVCRTSGFSRWRSRISSGRRTSRTRKGARKGKSSRVSGSGRRESARSSGSSFAGTDRACVVPDHPPRR
jgi:hypothetical protein